MWRWSSEDETAQTSPESRPKGRYTLPNPLAFFAEVDQHLRGAIQRRTDPLEGQGMRGFECSIAVESVDAIAGLVEEHGGEVILPNAAIPGIGWVVKLRDTEGNEVVAVEYNQGGR